MKEKILYHGIPVVGRMPLFTPDNRQAIRDNRKTQTRRVIQPQPGMRPGNDYVDGVWYQQDKYGDSYPIKCPYGKVDDARCMREPLIRGMDGNAYYRDDANPYITAVPVISLITNKPLKWRWKKAWLASIHMPTEAARTVRQITGVRMECVQEICPSDCEEEGITGTTLSSPVRGQPYSEYYNGDGLVYSTPMAAFAALWDSINASPRPIEEMDKIVAYKSFPWDEESCDQRKMINGKPHYCYPNSWVWVISFKKIDQ